MPLQHQQVSALKLLYQANLYPSLRDAVESFAKALFVSPGRFVRQTIEETLELVSCKDDNDNTSENCKPHDHVRFVALIERIFDLVSLQGITLEYPFTVALYCTLDALRLKHLSNGKYIEAGEAQKHLDKLFDFEVTERHREFNVAQSRKLTNLEKAHKDQFDKFVRDWEKFQSQFEKSAEKAIDNMRERHSASLHKYEQKLEIEARRKPRLFSKELKEWRRKERLLIEEQNYSEAQRVKLISDALEEEERQSMNAFDYDAIKRKSSNLKEQQENEMNALLKRIDAQRETFKVKKEGDSKCLLQRNQNIQSTWRSKYAAEDQKQFRLIDTKVRDEIAQYKRTQNIIF